MNSNIVSLNNHAYKFFGYDVNIVPTTEFCYLSNSNLHRSLHNGVSMIISEKKGMGKSNYYNDTRALRLDSHARRNLHSFNRHYHTVFNNKLAVSLLTIYSSPLSIDGSSYLVINSYKINGSSRYNEFEMITISSTNEVMNDIINTCLGKSIEQDMCYIIE